MKDATDEGPTGDRPTTATELVERVCSALSGQTMRAGDIVEAVGRASFPPLLLLPSLAVVSPLSGIPGFSSLCGHSIAFVAAQMLMRRSAIWLPGWLLRRRVPTRRLQQGFRWLRGPAAWLDRRFRPRLTWLVHRPYVFVPQLLALLFGLAMPFLEIVPFSSSILGAAVAVLAMAMLMRDGLLVLVSIGAAATLLGAIAYLVPA